MSTARIHDRGYRRYEGPRHGAGAAAWSVALHGMHRVLGLRRRARAKVLPMVVIALAYLPAIAILGVTFLTPEELRSIIPGVAEYYGFVFSAIYLFVAFVAPEVLCPDRRHNLLSLYLASPLTRDTYLVAKAVAVATILAAVTLGPPLLVEIGLALEGAAGADVATDLLRVLIAGVSLSLLFTAFALAASSLTDRRAAATGFILLVFIVGPGLFRALVALGAPSTILLLDLNTVAFELTLRIFGEASPDRATELPTAAVAASAGAWTVASTVLLRWRYARLEVTR